MRQRHCEVVLEDGTVIPTVYGEDRSRSESKKDEDVDKDDDLDEDDDTDTGDADDDGDDDSDDDESKGDKRKTRAELEADLKSALTERNRADRRARRLGREKSKAEQERDALKNGGQEELAAAQARVQELEAELASRSGTDEKALIRDSFRDSEKYDWHNRSTAFALLDLSEVDVEDGRVDQESLEDAIDKLAKEHPYLVKAASSNDDTGDSDEDEEEDERPRRSGSSMRSSRRRSTKQKTDAALVKDFPVINGRF